MHSRVWVTPMPTDEVAMLWRLQEHERFCRKNIPSVVLDQHIANLNKIQNKTEPDERALFDHEIPAVLRVILESECDAKAMAAGLDEPFATECLQAVIDDNVGLAMIYGACAGVSDEEKAFLLPLRQWATAKFVYDTRIVPLSSLGLRQILAANKIAIFDDVGISKINLSISKLFQRGVLSGHFRSRTSGRRKPKKMTYVVI